MGKINDDINQINNRLDIVELIKNSPKAFYFLEAGDRCTACTNENSQSGASLIITPSEGKWHDKATGEGGLAFNWIAYELLGTSRPRGKDVYEVLKVAAEKAGITLNSYSEEEKELFRENEEIISLFEQINNIWVENLQNSPEMLEDLKNRHGLTAEQAKEHGIGFSKGKDDLSRYVKENMDFDIELLFKSGLDSPTGGFAFFHNRITYPYFKNRRIVYFAGRATEYTPEWEKQNKYKKLQTYDEKNPGVSKTIQNDTIYGQDTIRGKDWFVITEGVGDCLALHCAGIPAISPITTQFPKHDIPKLLELAKGKQVYICNDNDIPKDGETIGAGEKGAVKTAEILEKAGIAAFIIILPKKSADVKIDVAEYLRDNSIEDFTKLLNSEHALGLWDYKLSKIEKPTSKKSIDKLRAYRSFIENDLSEMKQDEWENFVRNEVREKFGFTNKKDIETTVNEVSKGRGAQPTVDKPQATEKEKKIEDKYPAHIVKASNEILETGDPFQYILDIWQNMHKGDRNIGEHLLCSIAGTMIPNTRLGLHMKPSGSTGTGKSDAIETMLDLLPESKYITGSLSSKVLFYDESLKAGTIVYTDDAKVEGDIIVTLRAITSNYQKEAVHRTLSSDLEVKTRKIPPRVTIWMSSVNSIQDEQLQTRFCLGDTDESKIQDENVNINQKRRATAIYSPVKNDDILTCQCIFDMIFQKECPVYAPLIDAVEWNDKGHRRNFDKFIDMLFGVTLFNYRQRKTVYGGIVSTLEDYDRAVKIYSGTAVNNASNLNGKEIQIMRVIQYSPDQMISFTELQTITGIKETTLRYIMNGRDGGEGLLGKVKGLYKIEKSDSVGNSDSTFRTTTRGTIYKYSGDLFMDGSELFQTVVSIDRDKAERITTEFMASAIENTSKNHNSHITRTSHVIVENSNSSNDNDNNNVIITENGKKEGDISPSSLPPHEVEKKGGISLGGKKCDSCDDCSISSQPMLKTDVIDDVRVYERKSPDDENICASLAAVKKVIDTEGCRISNAELYQIGKLYSVDSAATDSDSSLNSASTKMNTRKTRLDDLRKRLILFVDKNHHCIVKDIHSMVNSFLNANLDLKDKIGYLTVLNEAIKLSERGWKL